ncbi:hypothetical protein [Tuberibacillus sp. Marseille-P3662]|uniref:hypothetical protein n=1 Tax=Tuberibacillus sp. Marseille-P3662 TaxID=1965358 RepID=UPI000A1C9A2A|nr:hypothetical protein [Tuberibacillus sp. Marseille-P3662]
MTNVLLKLVLTPVIVIFADLFLGNDVIFGSVYEALIVGWAVACANIGLEYLLFRPGLFWVATISDFLLAMCILFFGANMYGDAYIGTFGALLTAFTITIMEYVLHLRLLRKNGATKIAAH